tara:strand:+ start:1261 stop:1524 length:264 start_codon:yes stop_codon:yes gene_type:complete
MNDNTNKNNLDNPFKKMSIIRFWAISTLFYMFFPISMIVVFFTLGKIKTKQFLVALMNDFFQTILIFLLFICFFIWLIYYLISPFFT